MADPVTSGGFRLCEEHLRALLANCTAMQEYLGVDGEVDPADAATDKIHIRTDETISKAGDTYTAAELSSARPYAFIMFDPEQGDFYRRRGLGPGVSTEYGQLSFYVEADMDTDLLDGGREAEILRRLDIFAGDLVTEMMSKGPTAGYLDVTEVEPIASFMGHPRDEPTLGQFEQAVFRVSWGSEGGGE